MLIFIPPSKVLNCLFKMLLQNTDMPKKLFFKNKLRLLAVHKKAVLSDNVSLLSFDKSPARPKVAKKIENGA